MNYISPTLSHFVGRAFNKEIDKYNLQYNLLKDIVESGVLLRNPKEPPEAPTISSNYSYTADELGELFEEINCVCFCDIPEESLSIHTHKYSKFGIGFSKIFLANQGVRPVTYVPVNCDIKEIFTNTETPKTPAEYYSYLMRINLFLTQLSMGINETIKLNELYKGLRDIIPVLKMNENILDTEALIKFLTTNPHSMLYSLLVANSTANAYIKLFDPTLPENAENNYYMEREWRAICDIHFQSSDIETIYLPEGPYKNRFLSDFPKYKGNISEL